METVLNNSFNETFNVLFFFLLSFCKLPAFWWTLRTVGSLIPWFDYTAAKTINKGAEAGNLVLKLGISVSFEALLRIFFLKIFFSFKKMPVNVSLFYRVLPYGFWFRNNRFFIFFVVFPSDFYWMGW
jgi:hypothetical protein